MADGEDQARSTPRTAEVYGAPRIHAELRIDARDQRRAQAGRAADGSRPASPGLWPRKRGRTTVRVPGVRVADDLVERQFRPDAPDVLWIADFSYSADLGGVAVPRGRAGRVLAADRWLVHGRPHARASWAIDALYDGAQTPPPGSWGDPSLRPGIARRIQAAGSQRSISRRLRWAGRRGGQRVRRWAAGGAFAGAAARGPARASGAVLDRASGGGTRPWRLLLRLACRRPLASDGSVRVAGCHLSPLPRDPGCYLSFAEWEEIALLRAEKVGVREIARRIGRSPSTISRELRRNAGTRSGSLTYRASTAQWHADRRGRRPKSAKLGPTRSCAAMCRTACRGLCSGLTGALSRARRFGGSAGVTARARTGGGGSPGARSRSPIGCAWTSRMMSR